MDLSLAVPPPGPALSSGQYAELSNRIGVLEEGMPPGGDELTIIDNGDGTLIISDDSIVDHGNGILTIGA